MANLKIGRTNLVDAASLSVQSEALPGAPGSRLLDYRLAKYWRSGNYVAWARVDFGSAIGIDAVGAFGMNLAAGDSITIKLGSSAGGSQVRSDTVSGPVAGIGQRILVYPSRQTARHLEFGFTATSRSIANNFQVGRLWAGELYEFSVNPDFGAADDPEDLSIITRNPSTGVRTESLGAQVRRWMLQLGAMSPADKAFIKTVRRLQGAERQVLLIPDSDAAEMQEDAVLGFFQPRMPITTPGLNINAVALEIVEDK